MEGLTITRHDESGGGTGEYRAAVPGSDRIGRLTWVARRDTKGAVRVAEHTLVPAAIGGRGVAGKLVEALMADARDQGFRVEPACSYVAVAFQRHPEWSELRA